MLGLKLIHVSKKGPQMLDADVIAWAQCNTAVTHY